VFESIGIINSLDYCSQITLNFSYFTVLLHALTHSLPNTSKDVYVISRRQCQIYSGDVHVVAHISYRYHSNAVKRFTDEDESIDVSIYVFTSDILLQNNFLFLCKYVFGPVCTYI
jgi:hypothetical protein